MHCSLSASSPGSTGSALSERGPLVLSYRFGGSWAAECRLTSWAVVTAAGNRLAVGAVDPVKLGRTGGGSAAVAIGLGLGQTGMFVGAPCPFFTTINASIGAGPLECFELNFTGSLVESFGLGPGTAVETQAAVLAGTEVG